MNASVGNLDFEVYVTVPQDAWDKEVNYLEEELKDSDDVFDAGSDYDSVQHFLIIQLILENSFKWILLRLGALEQLRDVMVEDLVKNDTEHQFEDELQMLKGIKDFERSMIAPFDEPDDADEDEEFVVISNDYPQDLLDELARRFDGIQKK